MKLVLRIAIAIAFAGIVSNLASAQGAQVGSIYVGTCDGTLQNTRLNEVDVYTSEGQFFTAFHGPAQNSCLTGMTFDVTGDVHVISAAFGTQAWPLLEFDNFGDLLSSPGPFTAPVSVTHDLQGNLYLGQGNIVKLGTDGSTASYTVAGGAQWVTMASDQHTVIYSASNGDVKSFDVASRTQGPDLLKRSLAGTVRVLGDNSIMTDSLGVIRRWTATCGGCLYKHAKTYQIPANADTFALDPDGISFWTINTFYDNQNQLGKRPSIAPTSRRARPWDRFRFSPWPMAVITR